MICNICSHNCDIQPSQRGKCQIIQNDGIKLINSYYGQCSLVSVEPVEKHFIYHYNPGKRYLSVSLLGCPMHCQFCQNFKVSQTLEATTKFFSPNDLIDIAKAKGVSGLAFSFNEPTIHYRYVFETGQTRYNEMDLIIKTNGMATSHVWSALKTVVDAYNVDIKGNEEDYQRFGGSLTHVRNSIEYLFGLNHHVEICYLVTPNTVNNDNFHIEIRDWLYSLNKDTVVHLLYMYPFWKQLETYDKKEMPRIWQVFKDKLEFVYLSNLHGQEFEKYRAKFF